MLLSLSWQNTDWIITIICLALLIIALIGKLSPKFVIVLIILCGMLYLGAFRLDTVSELLGLETNVETQGDSIKILSFKPDTPENNEEKPPAGESPDPMTDQDKDYKPDRRRYKVKDHTLWTYQTDGFWEWDSAFIQSMENRTGWRKVKHGNYTISVNHAGTFSQTTDNNERKFTFSGSEIEIKVNGEICCCEGVVSLPKGLSANKFSETKDILQDTMTALMLKNENNIIRKISACF